MAATCEVTRIGPVTFKAPELNEPFLPEDILTSRIGGSSCVVSVTGPLLDFDRAPTFDTPGFWQGLYGLLYGKLGGVWVPIRNGNLPIGNFTGSRQWLNYEGAEYSGFQFRAVLTRSNFDPTQWPLICRDLHLEMIVGAGAGALPPGSGSILQQQVGPVPPGNDLPSVGAAPERRRLLVEIASLAPGATAGLGWSPSDVTPASWYPLQLGRQYAFATTAAAWLAVDPPGSAASFVVAEESG